MGVRGSVYYCDTCGISDRERPANIVVGGYGVYCWKHLPEDVVASMAADSKRRKAEKARQLVLTNEDSIPEENHGGGVAVATKVQDPEMDERHAEATEYARTYDGTFEFMVKMRQWVESGRYLTFKQSEAVLRCKANAERRVREQAEREQQMAEKKKVEARIEESISEGMYRDPESGTIYKVQRAVHGSGNLYAKRLVPPSEYGGSASFEYASGAIRRLRPEWRLTLEEAKEFGALYGACVRCARTLTREDSIERMMGPVCFKKMGF